MPNTTAAPMTAAELAAMPKLELFALARVNGIDPTGMTKQAVADAIVAACSALPLREQTIAQLKEIARAAGLAVGGTKPQLIARIEAARAAAAVADEVDAMTSEERTAMLLGAVLPAPAEQAAAAEEIAAAPVEEIVEAVVEDAPAVTPARPRTTAERRAAAIEATAGVEVRREPARAARVPRVAAPGSEAAQPAAGTRSFRPCTATGANVPGLTVEDVGAEGDRGYVFAAYATTDGQPVRIGTVEKIATEGWRVTKTDGTVVAGDYPRRSPALRALRKATA